MCQNNQGCASARKTGFDKSIGNIILFIDSDDWIVDKNFIKKLNNYYTNYDVDVVSFNFLCSNNESILPISKKANNFQIQNLNLKWFFENKGSSYVTIWKNAYKSTILKNDVLWEKYFNSKVCNEDWYFTSYIFSKNYKGIVTNEIFYAYRTDNKNSLTFNTKTHTLNEKLKNFNAWFTFSSKWNIYTNNDCRDVWISYHFAEAFRTKGIRYLIKFCKKNKIETPSLKEYKQFLYKYEYYQGIRKVYAKLSLYLLPFDYLIPKIFNFIKKILNRKN
ncbi:glycosyltransferase [Mycoplasmoides pirum]|uniref:glycosyltransferase n=1 Tax=Mycoplasmoides pirum TaxID=2122 RepID=UPI0024572EF9|nr:glycosyltransferase [Mycoplasmoides pirum]